MYKELFDGLFFNNQNNSSKFKTNFKNKDAKQNHSNKNSQPSEPTTK